MRHSTRWPVIAALGTAQTLAWASSYYLPAMLAKSIAASIGVSVPTVFLAFSLALVVSALAGPASGHAIDRWGGRPVLLSTNIIFAIGLFALANSQGPVGLFAAWVIIGVGMGSGLYEAAFAALVRLYGRDARSAITGITLIAGFASTVGWPLSAWLESHYGWRGACLAWAALHLVLGFPLNWSIPKAANAGKSTLEHPQAPTTPTNESVSIPIDKQGFVATLLAFVFGATLFTSAAMAAHLPQLLMDSGTTLSTAVAVGALVGPAQVFGRIVEFSILRRAHPLMSARLASLGPPIGASILLLIGAPAAAFFALLHGVGNGILTIAKGTLPLVLFGPQGYGFRQGFLMVPARISQAIAPALFGYCLARWGANALWLTTALGALSFFALTAIPSEVNQSR